MAHPSSSSSEDWVLAAYELVAEVGFEGTNVEAVAARLGVSKGGFYRRFPDRDALIDAVVNHWQEEGLRQVAESGHIEGPAPQLRAMLISVLSNRTFRNVERAVLLGPGVSRTHERVVEARLGAIAAVEGLLLAMGATNLEARDGATAIWRGYLGLIADTDLLAKDPTHAEWTEAVDLLITPYVNGYQRSDQSPEHTPSV